MASSRSNYEAAQQRDAADEGRLEASGSILVGTVIVSKGKVVRPSQLIASVGRTRGEEWEPNGQTGSRLEIIVGGVGVRTVRAADIPLVSTKS